MDKFGTNCHPQLPHNFLNQTVKYYETGHCHDKICQTTYVHKDKIYTNNCNFQGFFDTNSRSSYAITLFKCQTKTFRSNTINYRYLSTTQITSQRVSSKCTRHGFLSWQWNVTECTQWLILDTPNIVAMIATTACKISKIFLQVTRWG